MKRSQLLVRFLVAALFASPLFLPGNAVAQVSVADRDSLPWGVTMAMVEEGQTIFEGPGLCTQCHGPTAEGAVGPDLTDNDWLQAKGSHESIVQVILTGVPEGISSTGLAMPARGGTDIDGAMVRAVASYIWEKSHPDAMYLPSGVTDAMVERGEQIFLGEGGCALCHGSDATGLLGPDLTDDVWLDAKGSYKTIGRIIAEGIPEEASTGGVAMPARGGSDIAAADIERVAAYVWYLSRRD